MIAAVDIGTNSVRVLVADEAQGDGFTTVERLMRITRLGQGVGETGALAPEAIERTAACLRDYREVMDRHGVDRVRATATSAARDASNREDFFAAAEAALGDAPRGACCRATRKAASRSSARPPTSMPATARSSSSTSAAARPSSSSAPPTPKAWCRSTWAACASPSSSSTTTRPAHADGEMSAAISVAETYVRRHADDVVRALPGAGGAKTALVGLAGTVTTVAAVEIGLATYDRDAIHHFRLTRAAAEDVFRTLATENRADRIHNPGLEEARADVIVGGCCVLVALFRRLGYDEMLVSEADILDGLIRSQLP